MNMADSAPSFSICIPVYNGEKFIRTAIDSVLAQTSTDWELVIVDDASTDQTWKILQEYRDDPRIHLYQNQQNLGQGATFNRFLELAQGRWLGLLAADDYYEPDALATVESVTTNRSDLILWISTHQCFGEGIIPHVPQVYPTIREFGADEFTELLYLHGGIFGGISNFFFRFNLYRQTCRHRFPENTTHIDGDFWMRLMRANPEGRVLYWPDALLHTLMHTSSASVEDERSGRHVAEIFHSTEISISVGWSRPILFRQLARMLWVNLKFFSVLPRDQKFRGLKTARLLCQEILRS